MKKKCLPGVVCIETASMWFIIACTIVVGYFFVKQLSTTKPNNHSFSSSSLSQQPEPEFMLQERRADILRNPYAPPLRDERIFAASVVPINVSTNVGAVDTSYRQMGILTPTNTKGSILPLMGRPVFTNRDKWQYYTMSDQNNSVKLPISRNGKSCTNEYGCDRLFNGDTIYIEGLNEAYRVTIYDNDTIKYLPFF